MERRRLYCEAGHMMELELELTGFLASCEAKFRGVPSRVFDAPTRRSSGRTWWSWFVGAGRLKSCLATRTARIGPHDERAIDRACPSQKRPGIDRACHFRQR